MIWNKIIQPYLIHSACSSKPIMNQRKKIISKARGVVLEIGFGSGLNLPFYNKCDVEKIIALEPSSEMQKIALKKNENTDLKIEFLNSFAEEIPLKDDYIDTLVCTYTLCSVSSIESVLSEIKRVLKKDGKLLIIEHVKSHDYKISRFQNFINPIWKILAGGCNLNCETKKELVEYGFDADSIQHINVKGIPKFLGCSILAELNNIK